MAEKSAGVRTLLRASGVPEVRYLLSTALVNAVIAALVGGAMALTGAALELRMWSATGGTVLLALLGAWSAALAAFSLFLAALLENANAAVVLGYVVSIVGALLGC